MERSRRRVIALSLLVGSFVFVGTAGGLLGFIVDVGCACTKSPTPVTAFEFEAVQRTDRPDRLKVTHAGGDAVSNEELAITADVRFRAASGRSGPAHRLTWRALGDEGEEAMVGDSVLIELAGPDVDVGNTTVRVVWTDEEGKEWTLARREGPAVLRYSLSIRDPSVAVPAGAV